MSAAAAIAGESNNKRANRNFLNVRRWPYFNVQSYHDAADRGGVPAPGAQLNARCDFLTSPRLRGEVGLRRAMPTGRANARPMTGSASSGAIRVRGTIRESDPVESPPPPDPLPASGAREQ